MRDDAETHPRGQNHVFFSPDFRKAKSLPAKRFNSVYLLKVSLFSCFLQFRALVLYRIKVSPNVHLKCFAENEIHTVLKA